MQGFGVAALKAQGIWEAQPPNMQRIHGPQLLGMQGGLGVAAPRDILLHNFIHIYMYISVHLMCLIYTLSHGFVLARQ